LVVVSKADWRGLMLGFYHEEDLLRLTFNPESSQIPAYREAVEGHGSC
jgi:hypothetical protein